jgi:hypothetical protein
MGAKNDDTSWSMIDDSLMVRSGVAVRSEVVECVAQEWNSS